MKRNMLTLLQHCNTLYRINPPVKCDVNKLKQMQKIIYYYICFMYYHFIEKIKYYHFIEKINKVNKCIEVKLQYTLQYTLMPITFMKIIFVSR